MKAKLMQWAYNGISFVALIFFTGLAIADMNSYSNQDDTLTITYCLMVLFAIATIVKLAYIIKQEK